VSAVSGGKSNKGWEQHITQLHDKDFFVDSVLVNILLPIMFMLLSLTRTSGLPSNGRITFENPLEDEVERVNF
jgi:hypothetical protein